MDKILLLLLAGILLLLSAGTFDGGGKGGEDGVNKNAAGEDTIGKDTTGEHTGTSGGAGTALSEGWGADTGAYEAILEKRLEEVLAHVDGAGEVRVMITLKNSGEKVLQSDSSLSQSDTEEQDSQGGTRTVKELDESNTTVILSDGTADTPYITKETMPEVEGVLVVAQGAGNSAVKQSIYEAVQALFGVPAHKIKVLKGVLEK